MCGWHGEFYEVFASNVEVDTWSLYRHLAHVGLLAGGLFFLRKSTQWDLVSKGVALYMSVNLLFFVLLTGIEVQLDYELALPHLRVLYIGLLAVMSAAAWSQKSVKSVRQGLGILLLVHIAVVASFLPIFTEDVEIPGCNSTLSTKAYESNAADYSAATSILGFFKYSSKTISCGPLARHKSTNESLVLHGPFTISRPDGTETRGRFHFGRPDKVPVACISSPSVEF
ncbi:hypothetical protein FRD01_10070 [Microvenator marinus]|uniref:Uncharacterized protein n=1 Tax=Microvenator marinus TaxID=2600177 RepID=A0A5B8XQK7_9DELT|nr:hypothetical protein [Microvenator marinus]QED27581.1 hypothetical protein FRD01_10070 [Microvenator marinus]